jgi:hydrogenase nickel incorporation protein HypA/HybF
MHELSITENILEIALRHAEKAGDVHIRDLFLVVGELSSVIDDSVQFYWDIVSEGTAAHGARLHFRRIPAEFVCKTCASRYTLVENLVCPQCGGSDVRIIAGREFYLEAIEISDNLTGYPVFEGNSNTGQE